MSPIAEPRPEPLPPSPFPLRLPAVGALHVLLLVTALVPGDRLLTRPIANVDYWSHFYAAAHFAEHFANTLSFWGYDPYWMAGYPEGLVSLADNKLFDLLVWLAPHPFEAAVFNAAVFFCILSVPWVLHAAAYAAGATRTEAGGAALAGVALTFGAPMTVLFWTGGGISFFFSSLLAVAAGLRLVKALTESSLVSRSGARAVALAMLAIFVHPFALLPIGATLATTLLAAARPRARTLMDLAVVATLLLLPLAPVLAGALENRGQMRLFTDVFQGGPRQFVRDWGTHLFRTDDISFHGAGSLAAVTVAALLGVTDGTAPYAPAARRAILAAMAFAAGLAYVAAPLHPRLAALQPQRFLVAFGFFAAVLAGRGLARLAPRLHSRELSAWLLAVLLIAFAAEGVWSLRRVRVVASGADAAEEAIPAFLEEHVADRGRVLVESGLWPVPAARGSRREILVRRFTLLPFVIDRELLGSTGPGPFAAQRYAGFAFGNLIGRRVETLSEDELRELLARYAVSAVIGCTLPVKESLSRLPGVLEWRADLGDCRGFRVRNAATSRLLEGEGRVRATLDRIEVSDARGERLVLKYHWLPTLVTEPPLPIEEARQPGAPVGFIAVRPGGVRDFVIAQRGWRGVLGRGRGQSSRREGRGRVASNDARHLRPAAQTRRVGSMIPPDLETNPIEAALAFASSTEARLPSDPSMVRGGSILYRLIRFGEL